MPLLNAILFMFVFIFIFMYIASVIIFLNIIVVLSVRIFLTSEIKTSFIIGFYLRALRICSPQYRDEGFEYIEHSLKSLNNPKFLIFNARKNALKIHPSNKPKKNNLTFPITHRPISLPMNTHNIALYNKLIKLVKPIIKTISQTIKNLTNLSNEPTTKPPLMQRLQQTLHRLNPKQSRKRTHEHK